MSETPILAPVDPRKAQTWFTKAGEAERVKNWDYAVTAYVMGLQFDPDNLDMVKKLMSLGRNRKANGGKSGGGWMGESYSIKGSTPLVGMLNALESLAKDPDNPSKWERLVAASSTAGTPKVAEYCGDEFLKIVVSESAGSGKLGRLKMLKNHFKGLELYAKARLCLEYAQPMAPNDLEVTTEIKNLAAQDVTQRGRYDNISQGGSFRDSIKDWDKQKEMLQAQADVQSDVFIDEQIKKSREKWLKEPNSTGLLRAYVSALTRRPREDLEAEAVKVLEETYARNNEYQLRITAGDIKIRQAARKLSELKAQVTAETNPERKAILQARHDATAKKVLEIEIKEFQERCAKYPTDRDMRFELGRRCLEAGQVDDAIDNLQQAEQAPKLRTRALDMLGNAFIQKGWYEEAVDSFRRALETYDGVESDERSLSLHYNLGTALEGMGSKEDALKEFSLVARNKLTYRDVRDRVQRLRNEIKAAGGAK